MPLLARISEDPAVLGLRWTKVHRTEKNVACYMTLIGSHESMAEPGVREAIQKFGLERSRQRPRRMGHTKR
jgi:hypothetical protein